MIIHIPLTTFVTATFNRACGHLELTIIIMNLQIVERACPGACFRNCSQNFPIVTPRTLIDIFILIKALDLHRSNHVPNRKVRIYARGLNTARGAFLSCQQAGGAIITEGVPTFLDAHCIFENIKADGTNAAIGRRREEDVNGMSHRLIVTIISWAARWCTEENYSVI